MYASTRFRAVPGVPSVPGVPAIGDPRSFPGARLSLPLVASFRPLSVIRLVTGGYGSF